MSSFYKNPKDYQYLVSSIEYFKFLGSKYANRFYLKYHVSRPLIKYKQIQGTLTKFCKSSEPLIDHLTKVMQDKLEKYIS
jgi:hypothetical protein